MSSTKRKRKNKSNALLTVGIVMFLMIALVFIIMIVVSQNGGGAESSAQESAQESSQAESQASAAESSLPAESSEIPSQAESSQEESQTYEERVGVEYSIDITPYLEYIEPEEPPLVLVNLYNPLPDGFVPENLTVTEYTRDDGRAKQKLTLTAERALEAFLTEAALFGVNDVTVTSAYRDYNTQSYLFNKYVGEEMAADSSLTREEAEAIVITYSMRPGRSEHQTGLCCDMHNLSAASESFGETPEAKWLAENCFRFGFILRYPQDKEDVTGVGWEPWHFRFVGRNAATEMHERGLCLEEYVAEIPE